MYDINMPILRCRDQLAIFEILNIKMIELILSLQ